MVATLTREDRWLAIGQRTAAELDAVTEALQRVERSLIRPASRRECRWAARAATALRSLHIALSIHRDSVEADDGLLAAIVRAMPDAAYRVDLLRAGHRAFLFEVEGLVRDVDRASAGDCLGAAAIRRRAAALMDAVRADQAREVDLICEASDLDIWDYT